jgi:hypothetical protein
MWRNQLKKPLVSDLKGDFNMITQEFLDNLQKWVSQGRRCAEIKWDNYTGKEHHFRVWVFDYGLMAGKTIATDIAFDSLVSDILEEKKQKLLAEMESLGGGN